MEIQVKINVVDYETLRKKFEQKDILKAIEQLDNLILDEKEENYYGTICLTDIQINELVYLTKRLFFRRQYNFSVIFLDTDTQLKQTERYQKYDNMIEQLHNNIILNKIIYEIHDDKQDIDITKSVLKDLENIKSTGKFNPLYFNDEDDAE